MHDKLLSLRRLIGLGLLTRLLFDTGVQVFFPFLNVLAQGGNMTPVELGRLLGLRSLTGVFSPFFGAFADRQGYRKVMRLGLLLASLGYYAIGSSTDWLSFVVGLVLSGLGTFAYLPTLQSYLSAYLPYHRRARGLGMVEFSWALSGIVGLSLIGQLIALAGWRAPMFVLSGTLLLMFFYYRRLPSARVHDGAAVSAVTRAEAWRKNGLEVLGVATLFVALKLLGEAVWRLPLLATGAGASLLFLFYRGWPSLKMTFAPTFELSRFKQFFDLGQNRRSAWSALGTVALTMFAGMHVFISYGSWLLQEYGLGPAQLGGVALVLGSADLCGSVLVSALGDRLGKRRSVLIGSAVVSLAFFTLPWLNKSVFLAVVGLAFVRFSFEFTVVSNIPLLSEQVPKQRGKLMTLATTTGVLGTALSSITGPWAYLSYGVWGIGLIPALALLLSLALVAWNVREPGTEATPHER